MASQTGVAARAATPTQRTFLGHPVGLYVLFLTETWERFSYYGMRALLIPYMVNYLLLVQQDASLIYKWYTSAVYLTPVLGGYLADRYLGNKRAVVIGAILMAIGHFLMAFEPLTAFYSALAFLIVGNGFFKPNMTTQVGRLYAPNDARRDGAYTIFYMGVNLGGFLAPLACGWLEQNTVGHYHSGFTIAGIGMVIGLLIYLAGQPWVRELAPGGSPPIPPGLLELASPFLASLRDLQKQALAAMGDLFVAMVHLPELPPRLDLRRAGFPDSELRYDSATQTLIATRRLTEGDLVALMVAAYPEFDGVLGRDLPAGSRPGLLSEQDAEQTPSVAPRLNRVASLLLAMIGLTLAPLAPVLALPRLGLIAWNTVLSLEMAAVCALIGAWILSRVQQAARDRVLAIFALGAFVVFFWAAFEQTGNALNLWADKTTNRYLFVDPPPRPNLYPVVKEEPQDRPTNAARPTEFWERWTRLFELAPRARPTSEQGQEHWEIPTAWFQSVNALAILLLAPLFAALWVWLDRRGWNPSTPTKMVLGLVLMALSSAVMVGAARQEDKPTQVAYQGPLPDAIQVNGRGQLCAAEPGKPLEPFDAGRLTYDAENHTLHLRGVLPDTERDRIARATAPEEYVEAVKDLQRQTEENQGEGTVTLPEVPPGFDLKYTNFGKKVTFDPQTRRLTAHQIELADKDVKALALAGADRDFRDAIYELFAESSDHRVSSGWLIWCYVLATLGELCLSPVGLSMVSKLAPARFATMLMGLWMLTIFFGNFLAGALGEIWGTIPPEPYFMIFVAALAGAALVLLLLVRKIAALMHGVR